MIEQEALGTVAQEVATIAYPSLAGLKCPHCESTQFVPVKLAHKKLRMKMVMADSSVQPVLYRPAELQCLECGRRFEAIPHEAAAAERLAAPHTLTITREKNRLASTVYVMINGYAACCPIENGETIQLELNVKDTYIFIASGLKKFDRQNVFHLQLTDTAPDPEISFKFHPQFL